jgi:DNA-binding MarR family transcriptional regulator
LSTQANSLKESLVKIIRLLSALDESEMSCCGITLAQCHALVEIGQAGCLSLNTLAESLGLDKSTMSRTVENLVKQGFCGRESDAQDRRYVMIKLTPAGAAMYAQVKSGMDGWFAAIFDALPQEKRDQVLESAALLLEAISRSGCC